MYISDTLTRLGRNDINTSGSIQVIPQIQKEETNTDLISQIYYVFILPFFRSFPYRQDFFGYMKELKTLPVPLNVY